MFWAAFSAFRKLEHAITLFRINSTGYIQVLETCENVDSDTKSILFSKTMLMFTQTTKIKKRMTD